MRKLSLIFLIYAYAFVLFYAQATDTSILQDIQRLIQENHPNPYTKISKSRFESNISALKRTWNKKSETEQYYLLRKLISSIGDAHTLISKQGTISETFLPFFILPYGKHSIIVQVEEEYKVLAGKELISINGIKIKNILKKLFQFISYDKEEWASLQAHYECRLVSSLKYIKVLKQEENVKIKYKDIQSGNIQTLHVSLSKTPQINTPVFAELNSTLFQSGYYRALSLQDMLVIQYNICENYPDMSMSEFARRIGPVAKNVKKIVIDLRHNSGGDSRIILPLLEILDRLKDAGCKLFAIVGNGTFSSGVMAAANLKEMGVILIGEEVGWNGKFGEMKSFPLSNDKYILICSTKDFSEWKTLSALHPDIVIEPSEVDLSNGLDSAIEYIKKQ